MSVKKRLRDGQASETYWMKFRYGGKQYYRDTGQYTRDAAEKVERDERRLLKEKRIPDLLKKLSARADCTTGNLLAEYRTAKCPDRRMQPRAGAALETEERNLDTLAPWWTDKPPGKITARICDDYWQHRRSTVSKGTGDRTTELELQTLSNALNWAVRRGLIDKNPITKRPRYRDPKNIDHARDRMPTSTEEWHQIAAAFLADPRSEVHGWMTLLAGATGLREGELRLLRTDAQRIGLTCQPGYCDERYLHVTREKRGKNPRIRLDDPERPYIRLILTKIREWIVARGYTNSPWLFPGRDPMEAVSKGSLSKALAELCADRGWPHRSAHGLRAWYVSVRLAQGIDPEDVAREVGQGSGADLVRDVYGLDPDDFNADTWRNCRDTFCWTPKAPSQVLPAWEVWSRRADKNVIPLQQAG